MTYMKNIDNFLDECVLGGATRTRAEAPTRAFAVTGDAAVGVS